MLCIGALLVVGCEAANEPAQVAGVKREAFRQQWRPDAAFLAVQNSSLVCYMPLAWIKAQRAGLGKQREGGRRSKTKHLRRARAAWVLLRCLTHAPSRSAQSRAVGAASLTALHTAHSQRANLGTQDASAI